MYKAIIIILLSVAFHWLAITDLFIYVASQALSYLAC